MRQPVIFHFISSCLAGYYDVRCYPSAGLALSYKRLEILDLSPVGHQRKEGASDSNVIAFNGQKYNNC